MKLTVTAGRPKAEMEDGTYPVTVYSVSEGKIEKPQFGDGSIVRIEFAFDGFETDDGEPVIIDAIANPKLSPKSKLGLWCKALGFDLAIGSEFDLDDLIGAQGLAEVENEERDGQKWPSIINIVAALKTPANRTNGNKGGPMTLNDFWTKVREMGFDRNAVRDLGYDLMKMTELPEGELDQIIATLKELNPTKK